MSNSDLPPTWNCPTEVVLARCATSADSGLSAEAIRQLRERHGFNELAEAPGEPVWKRFLAQFAELVIGILVAAAVISGLMGEWLDTIAIVAIILMNGVLGFFQEERAERALAALQKLSSPMAKVLRDGRLSSVPARELVPGDIVELEAGDYVPADVRLLRAYGVAVQEAALTGESVPVEKDAEAVLPAETPLADRRNQAYFGTVVAAGKATAVVVATGMATELGRIAGLLQHEPRELTPLQRRLAELGRLLISLCLGVVLLVFLLQWFRGGAFLEALLIAVSLAVAAVPEGLPAVVTISLALGLQRMVRRNALVRKLPSVETLGSVSVVCSDKTGTLTRNEMTVRRIVIDDCEIAVTGAGYAPRGEFLDRASASADLASASAPGSAAEDGRAPVGGVVERAASHWLRRHDLRRLLTVAAWCNNARLTPPSDGGESWRVIGDPTEGALLVVAMKAEIVAASRDKRVVFELPFDSTRKAMSVAVASDDAGEERDVLEVYTKGAPEVVLAKCVAERRGDMVVPLTDARRRWWLEVNSRMAGEALRVLALAERRLPAGVTPAADEVERELVLNGLVGMIDPPRDEARVAVATCRSAGIRPVMITGDHPATALAIARELNLAGPDDGVMTGAELDQLSDEQLVDRVERVAVYARVSAEHKLRVVRAWKARGQVVAMTGDGVNDAPAVKAADIGIAMGITGTDVTKEASDMVLTDDNFASIVSAVEEGRAIFDNIRKVLLFLLSCNLGELFLLLVASLFGWPAPLVPIQLLWINLVTDGLPALALALEPPEPGLMSRPPRPPRESILSPRIGSTLLLWGLVDGLVGLIAFGVMYQRHPEDLEHIRAVTFCVIVFAELFRSLGARSRTLTQFQVGFATNPTLLVAICLSALLQLFVVTMPFARPVFEIERSPIDEWALIAVLSVIPITIVEIAKLLRLDRFLPE